MGGGRMGLELMIGQFNDFHDRDAFCLIAIFLSVLGHLVARFLYHPILASLHPPCMYCDITISTSLLLV